MKRPTILSLMGFILVLAVVITALRNADDFWAGGLLLGTPSILCIALIGALGGRERSRARRLGFAILGGGYFALAFLGLSAQDLARLPTTWLLIYIHAQVAPPPLPTAVYTVSPSKVSLTVVTNSAALGMTTNAPANPAASAASVRWGRLLPGAANLEAFSAVGHCLFALLAGLLGAAIAQWFRNRANVERLSGDS
jgi:hypothetical protein